MGTVWKTVGAKVGGAVAAAVVLSGGYVGGLALLNGDAETSEVSDVFTVTTPEETTAPEAPVDAPVAEVPAAIVEDVTEPAETTAPAAPEVVDPESIGTVGPDGAYTAAPPPQSPGEPPVASNWGTPPVQDAKLPGEPGYVPPTG